MIPFILLHPLTHGPQLSLKSMDLYLRVFFLGLGLDHFISGVALDGEEVFLITSVISLSALGTEEA